MAWLHTVISFYFSFDQQEHSVMEVCLLSRNAFTQVFVCLTSPHIWSPDPLSLFYFITLRLSPCIGCHSRNFLKVSSALACISSLSEWQRFTVISEPHLEGKRYREDAVRKLWAELL